MNDNDSIKRGKLKKQVLEYVRTHIVPNVTGVLALIEDAPAVPQEMSAREFVKARRRLCEAHLNAITQSVDDFVTRCEGCVLENYCEGSKDNVDGEVTIVERWVREHPEERSEEATT